MSMFIEYYSVYIHKEIGNICRQFMGKKKRNLKGFHCRLKRKKKDLFLYSKDLQVY